MPPKKFFSAYCVALSGKMSRSHADIVADIEKHGGTVINSVNDDCNFLISTEADVLKKSGKVASAIGKEVPILSENYLVACLKAKNALDIKEHLLYKKAVPKRKVSAGKAKAKPAAKRAKADAGPVETTDKIESQVEGGKVVEEKIKKGFMEATLTWDVELVLHDMLAGKDRFYNLQVLVPKDGKSFVFAQNWGRTGMKGTFKESKFDDVADAKQQFKRCYRSKTGQVWGSLAGSFPAIPGKYKLLEREAAPEPGAPPREGPGRWQYYLHNKVDGKKLGWYAYDEGAAKNMEKYWGQFGRDSSLNVRLIQSDYFKYEINFSDMIQRNTTSGMRRVIRRVPAGQRESAEAPKEIPAAVAPVALEHSDDDEDGEVPDDVEDDDEEEEGGDEEEAPEAAASGERDAPAAAGGREAPPAEEDDAAPAGRAALPADDDAAPAGRAAPPSDDPEPGARAPPPSEADTVPMETADTLPMRR